jgi:hypothetical protein
MTFGMALTARTVQVTDNVVVLQPCQLYRHKAGMIDAHHVIPHSWWLAAGKEVDTPMYNLCPTCHYNTHVAIDGLIKEQDVHLLPSRCVSLARRALAGAAQYGLTPALTL